MAAWFTVYCSRLVDHVTAADLLAAIESGDLHTSAEAYGIDDDEAVARALTSLKLEPDTGAPVRFRLTYGPPGRRPILIHIQSDPEVLAEVRDEAEELLDEARGPGVEQIRSHLGSMVEVAAVELGWSQMDEMGVVLAAMMAEHLAIVGGGLFQDPQDVWWAVEDGVPVRLAEPE